MKLIIHSNKKVSLISSGIDIKHGKGDKPIKVEVPDGTRLENVKVGKKEVRIGDIEIKLPT